MNTKITFAICIAALLMLHTQATAAPIVVLLDNGGGSVTTVGDALDDIDASEVGTGVAGPHAIPEIPGLTLLVTGVASSDTGAETNTTTTGLGINSDNDTDTDAFDAAFGQTVTLQFNQDVLVHALDFTVFDSGDQFSFAGTIVDFGDLDSASTDKIALTVPIAISAGADFSLLATAGVIGIEAFTIEVVTIPEPSSLALLSGLGFLGFARRRRSS